MYLLSNGKLTDNYETYISDALIFNFTITPLSIPTDNGYSINVQSQTYADLVKDNVVKSINKVDTRSKVSVKSAKIKHSKLSIELTMNGDTYNLEV